MATLKEHQAAMVDMLANGSGIPASASRLAHAMHDVIDLLSGKPEDMSVNTWLNGDWSTTPGLNDKALIKREKALKTDSPAKWPTPAEQRVKELENTIRQLKAQRAKDKLELERLRVYAEHNELPEQAGCRKHDTQVCEHDFRLVAWCSDLQQCSKCGATKQ